MAMRKIKKGDTVTILTGKSEGQEGKVLRVLNKGQKVIVDGANLVKKHVKPNPQIQEQGGIIEKEAAIHISNVALVLPIKKSEKGKGYSKVGVKTLDDGRKVRYFKYNDEIIDVDK